MDLTPFGFARRRDTVVILGAGATRGASFVDGTSVVKPPLDTDFFSQLRGGDLSQDADVQDLLKFIQEEFGDTSLSMEGFYSQVHLHEQFVADVPKGRGRRRSYEWAGKRFLRVLPELFGAAIADDCAHHRALVGALDAGDVVMSFNYDCVLDNALRDVGRRKWDPATGYGADAGGAVDHWKDHSGTGRFPKQGLRLLKLHGSLNWRLGANNRLELVDAPYERRADGELVLVPPLWQKSFDAHPFDALWRQGRTILTSTKALIFIGYSLPLTDVYTQAMLRIDVQELDFVLIANPDHEARSRIKRVLRSALRPATRIVELDVFSDVGRLLPPA